MSLKGGTGKSTFSVSLAKTLSAKGKSVGLLDLDFTSPCAQMLTNMETQMTVDAKKGFTPARTKEGIEVFSIGLLTEEDTPMLIRGTKKGEIAEQLINDVHWGSPDYLIVDFPSGIQEQTLTILRNMKLNRVVFVVQPDKLSLSAAKRMRKALKVMKVKVSGIIENMGTVKCDKCGNEMRLFEDSVESLCKTSKIKFLGAISFQPKLKGHLPINDEILKKVM